MKPRQATLLATLLFSSAVFAGTVFNQGPSDDATAYGISASRTADKFTLGASSTIAAVRFWGGPTTGGSPSDFSGIVTYAIYNDNAGSIGPLVASGTVSVANSSPTGKYRTSCGGPPNCPQYIYEFNLAAPLPLAGGTYWLELHEGPALNSNDGTSAFWATFSLAGSAVQCPICFNLPAIPQNVSLAFQLLDRVIAVNSFQLKYFNTNYGSGQIVVSNAGTASTGGNPADDSSGTICANFYSFDPNEEMQTCCSCPVTPNGLSSLNVNEDIVAQNLIVNPSSAITVKVLFTLKSAQNAGGICDPSKAGKLNLAPGGLAWGTNLRNVTFQGSPPSTVNAVTETRFTHAELSDQELTKLATYCQYIKILGSSVSGICKSCQAGARGAIGR